MTLLNTTNDGLPNLFALLYEHLLRQGGISDQDIRRTLAPQGLSSDDGQMLLKTLRRWTELGVFVVSDNVYSVDSKYRESPTDSDTRAQRAARVVARKAIFAKENNLRFWESRESKAADLTRSLAWLLAQPVHDLEWSRLEEIEANQLSREDARFAKNDTRLNGLRMWARYLGFIWEDIDSPTVDPTLAIRETLDEVLPRGSEINVRAFVERIGAEVPVLDGGAYRVEVEKNLARNFWVTPGAESLSTSLSRALRRLRREGEIELLPKADARDSVFLRGPGGKSDEKPFAIVKRLGGS